MFTAVKNRVLGRQNAAAPIANGDGLEHLRREYERGGRVDEELRLVIAQLSRLNLTVTRISDYVEVPPRTGSTKPSGGRPRPAWPEPPRRLRFGARLQRHLAGQGVALIPLTSDVGLSYRAKSTFACSVVTP